MREVDISLIRDGDQYKFVPKSSIGKMVLDYLEFCIAKTEFEENNAGLEPYVLKVEI